MLVVIMQYICFYLSRKFTILQPKEMMSSASLNSQKQVLCKQFVTVVGFHCAEQKTPHTISV